MTTFLAHLNTKIILQRQEWILGRLLYEELLPIVLVFVVIVEDDIRHLGRLWPGLLLHSGLSLPGTQTRST